MRYIYFAMTVVSQMKGISLYILRGAKKVHYAKTPNIYVDIIKKTLTVHDIIIYADESYK